MDEKYKLYSSRAIPSFLSESPNNFLNNLLTIIFRAGSYALSARSEKDLNVEIKGIEDFVTAVDISNQNYLVEELLKVNWSQVLLTSDSIKIGFVLEEDTDLTKNHSAKGDEDIFVYIDPIDGTTSYKDGQDNFSIGVCVAKNTGEVFSTVVYLPVRQEFYITDQTHELPYIIDLKGEVKLIQKTDQSGSIQRVAAHYNKEHREKLLEVYSVLSGRDIKWPSEVANDQQQFGESPIPGSLMMDLCDLAVGKYDLLINGGAHLWDVAPAFPILEKTGYAYVDWSGKKIDLVNYKGRDRLLNLVAGKPESIEMFFNKLKTEGIRMND